MNNKIEALFNKHIERLEADITATQKRINNNDADPVHSMEAISVRDDAKKVALLREGVLPKYSDLPAGQVTGLNGLPKIVMGEFADLLQETDEGEAAMRDLDLIDYGKSLSQ